MTKCAERDWSQRIRDRAVERGFSTVTKFAASRPQASYLDLAEVLGDDVAAVQVERLLRDEAEQDGTMTSLARGSLVRRLRERVGDGWGVGDGFDVRAASAFASWNGGLLDEHADTAWAVWERLRSADPPAGWLPTDGDDPFILAAFEGADFGRPR